MKDEQCVRFLQWALPRLDMKWSGFRKVRRQVCKRIDRRLRHLGLVQIDEYRDFLETHDEEWQRLDSMCRITISRFYRDKRVFKVLAEQVLPTLADQARERGDSELRIWSAGCASGEEPYTLLILWGVGLESRFPEISIDIVATDADPNMIQRARDARYKSGSLKDLPEQWRNRAFDREGDAWWLKPDYERHVGFFEQDIRHEQPDGPFDLVLCRNFAFTYYDDVLQNALLGQIAATMHRGAALVLGVHEHLPRKIEGLSVWYDEQRIWRKTGDS